MSDWADETQQGYQALRAAGDRGYNTDVIESLIAADAKHKLNLGYELLLGLLEFISDRNGRIRAGEILRRELEAVSWREYSACSVAAQVSKRLAEGEIRYYAEAEDEYCDARISAGVGVSFSSAGGGRDGDEYYYKLFVRRGERDYKVFRCWFSASVSMGFSVTRKLLPR